jgi:D-alanyl-D-alanine carboxypeptidase/D-alanyl-D-alanine-endopeptidase (penicillin-binding protein 4)
MRGYTDRQIMRLGAITLVVLLLVMAGLSYRFDLGTRWFGWEYPSPITEPAEVEPPPGLTRPAPQHAGPVARETDLRPADPEAVRRALAHLVRNRKLGPHVAVAVDQIGDGEPVFRYGADRVTPASTMKLLTTSAALASLGPDHRFRTTVVSRPHSRRIVLVGGGDPLLARTPDGSGEEYPSRADLKTLAKSTVRALKSLGRIEVRLSYDTSLFTGPAVNPTWPSTYISDNVVSPITPLWVDEGRAREGLAYRSPDPAAAAAKQFAQDLERYGIKVTGPVTERTAARGAEQLAAVQSAPLRRIVQYILEVSDNEGAEVLLRHVALAEGEEASFEGGVQAVRDVLTRLGIDTTGERILDGSGLSRRDRIDPETLLSLLETAAEPSHAELRPVLVGLPVAGFSGSLAYRFATADREGLGLVHAKTGTLTGVHGLAGVVTTVDGTVLDFVAIADRVKVPNTLAARAQLDRIAAALAACTCAARSAAGASGG